MPYVSPAQRSWMYANRPDIANKWNHMGHNYIAGKGGGAIQNLGNRFNTALGGIAPQQVDPYLAQARQQLLANPQMNPMLQQPMGIRPMQTPVINTASILPNTLNVL